MCSSVEILRRLTFKDLEIENSPCTVNPVFLHTVQYDIEFRVVPLYDSALAEPPHDSWAFVKRAEHDRCSAILVQMADSLNAGACGVHVGDMVAVEDTQS